MSTTSGLAIEALDLEDVSAIEEIEQRSMPAPWSRMMFVSEIVKATSICLGAFVDDALVAYVIVSRYVDAWHIMNVAVDPDRPDVAVYRTGDLGRRREDGAIVFLGRRDRQVKVRGVRIEVEEIEQALSVIPAIAHAVVDLRPVAGEDRLVAYLQARDEERPSNGELRAALRASVCRFLRSALHAHFRSTRLNVFARSRRWRLSPTALRRAKRCANFQTASRMLCATSSCTLNRKRLCR